MHRAVQTLDPADHVSGRIRAKGQTVGQIDRDAAARGDIAEKVVPAAAPVDDVAALAADQEIRAVAADQRVVAIGWARWQRRVNRINRARRIVRVGRIDRINWVNRIHGVNRIHRIYRIYRIDGIHRINRINRIDGVHRIDGINRLIYWFDCDRRGRGIAQRLIAGAERETVSSVEISLRRELKRAARANRHCPVRRAGYDQKAQRIAIDIRCVQHARDHRVLISCGGGGGGHRRLVHIRHRDH